MGSDYINLLFLSPLIIIGIACSYTDIKYGKIFNKWIVFSFITIFFLYVFLFFYGVDLNYILEAILNGAIAFLGGYLLWQLKLWSAGDAKLFSIYAFLIPLHFYSKSYIPYFPSFNLLINLFIPILFMLIVGALITMLEEAWGLKSKIKELKFPGAIKIVRFSTFWVQIFLTYLFVTIILQSFLFLTKREATNEFFSNNFLLFILFFLIMGYLTKKMQRKKWLIFISYGLILVYSGLAIVSGELQFLITALKTAFVFMILVGLTRRILNYYIQKKQTERVKIKDIREGMVIAKDKISPVFKKLKEKGEEFGIFDAGGVKKNQLELIKNLFKDDREVEVVIYKTFPFAPFLFLSAVISITTQSSFLLLIDGLFRYLLG